MKTKQQKSRHLRLFSELGHLRHENKEKQPQQNAVFMTARQKRCRIKTIQKVIGQH